MRACGLITIIALARTASAEPEGYRGGRGRSPGTEYRPADGSVGISVRSVTRERATPGSAWTCGGIARSASGEDVITITIAVANRSTDALETVLPWLDLVSEERGEHVDEGACVRDGEELPALSVGAHQRAVFRVQFLVARKARPKTLVWNDDDFPALFALPAAKRSVGRERDRQRAG